MSGSGGYSINITATDSGASAVIDKVNKSIASLTASGTRTTKALERFGEVSGIHRLSEGMQSLGRSAADAFRSIDQTGTSLSALFGPATLAGITVLMQKWGAAGQQLVYTAHALNLSVEQLSRLQNTAIAAGVPVSSVTNALGRLQNLLYASAYQADPNAVRALKMLQIEPGTPGHVTDLATAWEQVIKTIQGVSDPHTRQMMLDVLGADRTLLPLIEEYEKFRKVADQSGANVEGDAAKHAQGFADAWNRLSLNMKGIYNQIADDMSGFGEKFLKTVSGIIEAHQKESVTASKWGLAAITAASWNAMAWGLGKLGLSLPRIAVGAPGAAAFGAYVGMTAGKRPLATQEQENAAMNRAPDAGPFGVRPPASDGAAPPGGAASRLPTGEFGPASWYHPEVPRGTGPEAVGMQAHNPLNMRYGSTAQRLGATGSMTSPGGFNAAVFPSMSTGVAATLNLLKQYQTEGYTTLRQMFTHWVNDPGADLTGTKEHRGAPNVAGGVVIPGSYLGDLGIAAGIGPDERVDLNDPRIAAAIIRGGQPHESGPTRPTESDIQAGVDTFLGRPPSLQPSAPPQTQSGPAAADSAPSSRTGSVRVDVSLGAKSSVNQVSRAMMAPPRVEQSFAMAG